MKRFSGAKSAVKHGYISRELFDEIVFLFLIDFASCCLFVQIESKFWRSCSDCTLLFILVRTGGNTLLIRGLRCDCNYLRLFATAYIYNPEFLLIVQDFTSTEAKVHLMLKGCVIPRNLVCFCNAYNCLNEMVVQIIRFYWLFFWL